MSGFVGLLNLDGEPVDRVLLERLTQSVAFRGPDEQRIYCQGPLGLGHAMLRTTTEAAAEKQPAAPGERLFIIADARIDARAELIAKLRAKNGAAVSLSLSTPDSELILCAYDCWGEACVDNLLGDFSFAIWDTRERRLFCARDQMGVKPFFYARSGSTFVFGNTLDCLRMHPGVSSRLNDLAIADFLLFDMHRDPEVTSFADILRLPPAHVLKCEARKICVRRYWALPKATFLQYRHDNEYLEHFRELLDSAVADRLRTKSAGVLMSGGLDSPIVAASARRGLERHGNQVNLRAYTEVFDSLIPHEERHYATLVADKLRIPIKCMGSDHFRIFERAKELGYLLPEPWHLACHNMTPDLLRQIAANSRVALTGFGGDPALCGRISVHLSKLLEAKQFGRALADLARYLMVEGRFSRLYLRTRWRKLFDSKIHAPAYPGWLNQDLEKRLGLRDRWEFISVVAPTPSTARPEAHEAMASYVWENLFEEHDAGITRVAVDVRHPFFDLRLVSFLLALPRLPWCCDKQLLREAALGDLPDVVRLRRKSPLPADPLIALVNRRESVWVDRFEPVPGLENYVVRNRIPTVYGEKDPWTAWMHLRPLSLNFWLHRSR